MNLKLICIKPKIPKNAEFYTFKRLNTQQSCRLTHFQLRNVLCVTSRNDYYYSTTHTVVGHHPITNNTYDLMDLGDHPDVPRPVRISTLGASTGLPPEAAASDPPNATRTH